MKFRQGPWQAFLQRDLLAWSATQGLNCLAKPVIQAHRSKNYTSIIHEVNPVDQMYISTPADLILPIQPTSAARVVETPAGQHGQTKGWDMEDLCNLRG